MTTTVTATPATSPTTKHPALGPFHDRREMALGWVLAGLAGATGAAAWLFTSGWYVTFMLVVALISVILMPDMQKKGFMRDEAGR